MQSRFPLLLLFGLLVLLALGCTAPDAAEPQAAPESATDPEEAAELMQAVRDLTAGGEGQAGQRIEGRSYRGPWEHPGGGGCSGCHAPEQEGAPTRVTEDRCRPCHGDQPPGTGAADRPDHDGDGDNNEALAGELEGLLADLLAAIQASATQLGTPICYAPDHYPHWMKDDGDGQCSAEESRPSNTYPIWTETILQASANYETIAQDSGAWAHNFDYAAQLAIDSIALLGGETAHYARPD